MIVMQKFYTPAMQQYIDMKKEYSDCVLFFRLWDFYETFFDDARICSKVLDIVLTSKNKNSDDPIPMAGIPYHSADKYVQRLVSQWYKIAIAEQIWDVVPGRLVERKVQSIVTPWTYIRESEKKYKNIVAVCYRWHSDSHDYHIARWDFSVWSYYTKSFDDIEELFKFLLIIDPVECVIDPEFPYHDDIKNRLQIYNKCLLSVYDVPVDTDDFVQNICGIQTISSFGSALESSRVDVFALLLNYIQYTQKSINIKINRVSLYADDQYILLDNNTIKNLEIFQSSYENTSKHSLIWILNNTRTAWWSRMMYDVLSKPLSDINKIELRQSYIKYFLIQENLDDMYKILWDVHDISKMLSTIIYKPSHPLYFIKLRSTLAVFFEQSNHNSKLRSWLVASLIKIWISEDIVDQVRNLYNYLDQLLRDAEDVKKGENFIREWYNEEIDDLRKIAFHSDDMLLDYQSDLIKHTWISIVKMKYVKNQWYFIEISDKDVDKLESASNSDEKYNFYRRQTLKNVQRYTTWYLDKLQDKILSAKDELNKKEYELLNNAKNKIESIVNNIQNFAESLSMMDVYISHAVFIKDKNWVCPDFVREDIVEIVWWRHPVIEEFLPIDQHFIANDLRMIKWISDEATKWQIRESGNSFVHIVTGPNMGGKSTFLRQNAIVVLLAHCGFWVPAKKVKLNAVDAIFARVWSGDVIAKNQSTFMTEMIEVANILNNASDRSFIIFDELGRGTSTYDGLALTQAILYHVASKIKSKTIIATHYHELIEMENILPWVKNFSVSVYETDKEVVFLKKIVKWWASKSYGIDVAKLAGISHEIISMATNILEWLNSKEAKVKTSDMLFQEPVVINDPHYEKIKKILNSYDLNNITPLQALQLLAKIKDSI